MKEKEYEKLFGPIFYKYMYKMDQYINYLDDGNTVFLYATRAGYRIKKLFDIYKNGEVSDIHKLFMTSRFLIAKSFFTSHHFIVKELLMREYHDASTDQFIQGLLRSDKSVNVLDFQEDEYTDIDAVEFIENFGADVHKDLYEYLVDENEKYTHYFNELVNGKSRVVIIDSGWSGTIQKMLSKIFPQIEFYGLYFGKIIDSEPHWQTLQKMAGLMFEINNKGSFNKVSDLDTETVFNVHRHLIEDLLEPSFPTIEYIESHEAGVSFDLVDKEDKCFLGVVHYFENNNSQVKNILDIYQKSDLALDLLKEKILYPGKQDVELLGSFKRSLDFGKEESVKVLEEPIDRFAEDSKELRIKESIWSQGQIFLEYENRSHNFIRQKQKENLEIISFKAPKETDNLGKVGVAVITRTMDREILLKRAKDSVEQQGFDDYMWIIINDAGDLEPVLRVVNEALIDPRRIIIVNNLQNIGMEAASNRAISMVDSTYIIIHDDDDSWDPTFLEKTVKFLKSKSGRKYGAVITDTMYVSESIENNKVTIHEKRPYNDWINNVHITEMAHGNMFAPICFLFKRSLYDKIGGFDENLPVLGDWNFNLNYLMKADIGVIKEPLAYYYHRDRDDDENSAYSNSVIGGMSKHIEYASIVKNKFIRQHPEMMGMIISNGFIHNDFRGQFHQVNQRLNSIENTTTVALRNLHSETHEKIIDELRQDIKDTIVYIHNDLKEHAIEDISKSLMNKNEDDHE